MKRIFELANAKTMPIVDFGPDGLVEPIGVIKEAYGIGNTFKNEPYIGYMLRDASDIADGIIRNAVGSKLEKYGIEEVGCYCIKGNEWIMELKINEDRCALNGLYWWETFLEDERCKKYVENSVFDDDIFDVVKFTAMAMIVEGIINEDLESPVADTIDEAIITNVRLDEYYKTANNKF